MRRETVEGVDRGGEARVLRTFLAVAFAGTYVQISRALSRYTPSFPVLPMF